MRKNMISIIVPIYNVEKYLPKCLESLVNQSYRDIEIILIDDGSPDRCGQICDDYAKKDSRIVVIHQKNQGVSAARNAGLVCAKGEYIGFVDPDDWVDLEMYGRMLEAMIREQADMVICGYEYVNITGEPTRKYAFSGTEIINSKDVYKRMFDMPPTIRLVIWNKLFKKTILKDIFFSENIRGAEDAEVLGKYVAKINGNVAVIHKPFYKNFERPQSATRGGLKLDSVIPALDIYLIIWNNMRRKFPDLNAHVQAYYLDACLLNYGLHCKNEKLLAKMLRRRVLNEFPLAAFNKEIYWKTRIYYLLFGIGMK